MANNEIDKFVNRVNKKEWEDLEKSVSLEEIRDAFIVLKEHDNCWDVKGFTITKFKDKNGQNHYYVPGEIGTQLEETPIIEVNELASFTDCVKKENEDETVKESLDRKYDNYMIITEDTKLVYPEHRGFITRILDYFF